MFEGAFEVIMFHLVETIHVELSHEAVHFFVTEVAREYNFFEFDDIFNDEFLSVC